MEPSPELPPSNSQRPDEGNIEMTAAEAERYLLKRLEDSKDDPHEALCELSRFYSACGLSEKALDYLRQAMARLQDPEHKAACVLAMGAVMERADDYEAAVRFYKEAFALEPVSNATWYYINNNLGYSLNALGRFAEGESYCRSAIEINPALPNGYKNLGLAHRGQGRLREAAQCFIAGTRACPRDRRSSRLLTELLVKNPDLEPEFAAAAEECRRLVAEATGGTP